MDNFGQEGANIRIQAMELLLNFMKNSNTCAASSTGLRQAEISRLCGLETPFR